MLRPHHILCYCVVCFFFTSLFLSFFENSVVEAVFLVSFQTVFCRCSEQQTKFHGRRWVLCRWRSWCCTDYKVLQAPDMPWPRPGLWDSVHSDFCGPLWSLHGRRHWRRSWRTTRALKNWCFWGVSLVMMVFRPRVVLSLKGLPKKCIGFHICCQQALANALQHNRTLTKLLLFGSYKAQFCFSEGIPLPWDSVFYCFFCSQALAEVSSRCVHMFRDPFGDAGRQARRNDFEMTSVGRLVRRVDAPGAALWQALEQIEERLQANQEAAAEADGYGLGGNTLLQTLCCVLFSVSLAPLVWFEHGFGFLMWIGRSEAMIIY